MRSGNAANVFIIMQEQEKVKKRIYDVMTAYCEFTELLNANPSKQLLRIRPWRGNNQSLNPAP